MIAQVRTSTLVGIEALPVIVEVDLQPGEARFIMVGLADKAVQESQERVRTAIRNSSLDWPVRKVICNLAPGDLKKEGPAMDLPIAIAILAASGQIPLAALENTVIVGELSLDGSVRHIDGAVNIALMAHAEGHQRLLAPAVNASEAAVLPGLDVYAIGSLLEAVELLNGSLLAQPHQTSLAPMPDESAYEVDFSDIKGQRNAIRALEIAAAGAHNVLMTGPPGSGKTMLARRLPTILPPLNLTESIAVTRIYSAAGERSGREGLVWQRPFRSPHHTASYAAIVGGGIIPRPGEISMAHHGVLFLDEAPEFDRKVLEALRQPLEDGVVTVARVQNTMTFPAEAIVVAAMNPCPCGFKGYPEAKCVGISVCEKYAGRLSGPLLDRIDLHLDVPRLKPDELTRQPTGEPSSPIRERVQRARERQEQRYGPGRTNGKMTPREVRETIELDDEGREFMRQVAQRLNLSARVFDRLLKVSRTIADLADADRVQKRHLAEAVQYRSTKEA